MPAEKDSASDIQWRFITCAECEKNGKREILACFTWRYGINKAGSPASLMNIGVFGIPDEFIEAMKRADDFLKK
jgi:hypothetical protein